MGYDLIPRNDKLESFYLGTFSFPVLLEACGYLFPCIQNGAKWYCVFGVDERMPKGHSYPTLISNDDFRVTAGEARIMARMARNFVAVQRSLPDQKTDDDKWLKPVLLCKLGHVRYEKTLQTNLKSLQNGPKNQEDSK